MKEQVKIEAPKGIGQEIEFFLQSTPAKCTACEPHIHNALEMLYVIEGSYSVILDDVPYEIEKGDMILLPPGVKHNITIHNPEIAYQRFVFWITANFAHELQQLSEDYVYLLKHSKETKQYIYHFDTITFNTIQSKLFSLSDEIHFNHFGKFVPVCKSLLV